MKTSKILLGLATVALVSGAIIAADHIDAPEVQGGTSDITDFYAFEGATASNLVLVANVQALITPENSSSAKFDEDVMIEFNIDTNNDNVEDYVIQAIPNGDTMEVYGPAKPNETGAVSTVLGTDVKSSVAITPYRATEIGETVNADLVSGVKVFAGLRDDPFFMDFARYSEIIAGQATSFNNPGADTFAGTNVLSVVVEVPKVMIGGTGTVNTWVTTKRKQ